MRERFRNRCIGTEQKSKIHANIFTTTPLILTVDRVGAVGQGLAVVCLGLGVAFFFAQVNDVGIAASQKDEGGVLPVHVRGDEHLLLHVGVLKTNLGHGGGWTERFADEIEDGLGVVLSDGIDELLARKLVEGKTLRGQIASDTELLLMMRGPGIEVIEGVLIFLRVSTASLEMMLSFSK